MIKNRAFKGLAFLASALLVANAHADSVQPLREGMLTIGSDLSWAPFEYFDGDEPAGFDIELMGKIAQGMGLKPDVVDTRFANLVIGLSGKKFDVIASALYITPARAAQIDYVPYLKTGGALMTLKGSEYRPQRPEDLCGKRVASLKGAAWVPMLGKLSTEHCVATGQGPIAVQEYESSPASAQALLARAADVQFDDVAVSQMLVKQTRGRLEITSTELLEPVVIGLGVAKGNTELRNALTAQLERLRKNGEYQALLAEYNLQEPTAEEIAAAYVEK